MAQRHGGRWTSSVAQRILLEQERSGLSLEGFAQKHGWNGSRLRWWRKQLGNRDVPGLLPVRVVEPARSPLACANVEVLLRGSGHTLRLGGTVDLLALVAVLEGGC